MNTEPLTALHTLGGSFPNLRMEQDSEKGYEFLVQLEVKLEAEDARKVQADLATASSVASPGTSGEARLEALHRVEHTVTQYVDTSTTSPIFRQIIQLAFEDNYHQLGGARK
jgi:hypothetical protein